MSGYTLYGMPSSLFTGKPRAYLRKQGIDFVEHPMGSTHFRETIVPKIGRFIVPVLETPEGALVQDGTDIIEYFERKGLARWSAYPTTPKQHVVALISELFGGEGLLRPAMHYRWNFPDQNEHFLRTEFGNFLAPGRVRAEKDAAFDFAARRMKQAMELLGVSAATIPAVEAAYAEFLNVFDAHLDTAPYLLGGRPSIGDYGLLAPLFAHLGRDPRPADLMRRTAPRVARWVERMNAPGLDSAEFTDIGPEWFADDAIPATLAALLRYVGEEYANEIGAQVEFVNRYLGEHPEIREGDVVGGRPNARSLGRCDVAWRGVTLSVGVFPYRVWLLQRVQAAFGNCDRVGQDAVRALLKDAGLERLLDLRTSRRVERRDNREVWGAAA
ncbi:MAG: glutathione S-transferase family protein [Micropepsaceae bacterium]